MIRPPRLRRGARIALVAPAGPLAAGSIERAAERVRALGWEPVLGAHCGKRRGYLAGSDAERAEDLTSALTAPDNDAIWLLRGGYGSMRILPLLDLTPLLRRPRPLIGFSDNTALHLAVQRLGIVSFHGPHPAAPELPEFSLDLLYRLLTEAEPGGVLPLPAGAARPRTLVGGRAEGRLVGGNLSLLAATIGTRYEVQSRDTILFLEEVGEPAYRLDRLLSQLVLAGTFDEVGGVAVGAISAVPDAHDPELPSALEIVRDRLHGVGVPLVYGFPFGHIPLSWTLPLGVRARLDATDATLELLEPAVS